VRIGADGNGGISADGDGVERIEDIARSQTGLFFWGEWFDLWSVNEALIEVDKRRWKAGGQVPDVRGVSGLVRLGNWRESSGGGEKAGAEGGEGLAGGLALGDDAAGAQFLVFDDGQRSGRDRSGRIDGLRRGGNLGRNERRGSQQNRQECRGGTTSRSCWTVF